MKGFRYYMMETVKVVLLCMAISSGVTLIMGDAVSLVGFLRVTLGVFLLGGSYMTLGNLIAGWWN